MTGARDDLPRGPITGRMRVVLFCGPVLERGMIRFARLLEAHDEIEFVGGFCQSEGLGTGARLRDLFRRRGVLALALIAVDLVRGATGWLLHPRQAQARRRDEKWLRSRLRVDRDIHDPSVLDQVERSRPDLGLIYGGPILRPELFSIPRYGTLGIHHGKLPTYRGKKTTFWALYHDEATVGVTIQKVNAGIDTGEVVREGELPARGRSYRRLDRELEELGLDLYLDAVVSVRRGRARPRPIEGEKGRLFRDPRPRDFLRFLRRRSRREVVLPHALLLTESYHPMTGGGETQARALASALRDAGVEVGVITRRWDPRQPAVGWVDSSPVWRVPPTGRGHLKKWALALTALVPLRSLRRSRPALLVSGFRVLGIPAVLMARWNRQRVLLKADSPGEISGAFFDPGLRRFGLSHRSAVVRPVLAARNALLRRADAFVAISSALETELIEAGIDRSRVFRIPNGVDVARFRPVDPDQKRHLRDELGLDQDRTLVIYTGRLVTYKGLPLLLEAWSKIVEEHPRSLLLLVGSGGADIHNCEDQLRQTVRQRGLQDHVDFRGEVEDVSDHLRASDFFVFPSQEEAFGLAVVEAMACGLPVVSTRVGGLADFVDEAHGALAVEAGDAASLADGLRRVLSETDLASELAARGPEAVRRQFSLDAVRDRYLAWIRGASPQPGVAP